MFAHLLVLLCASISVIAKPAPEPNVVIIGQNVGNCASGFPVCCKTVSPDYSGGEGCLSVPSVNACGDSVTALCCQDTSTVEMIGTAENCTVYH
ncbi:uncharacterized protein EDB93DRAFT_1120209 [Suillus bovinus]|uniref:uncharacterized protein n=1 Tax=Suillus bovinus TaxID=48563 RepID=UPI001B876CF1|nr:uncharacterized protein EDB93DRAFT_1120209 [Suillus bovinus]KAG2158783.1 hypothetical protein EDB93DRAFT_1120209 [Suillus bovinus]